MKPPSLAGVPAALRCTDRRWEWVAPTDEEDDTAAVIEHIDTEHRGSGDRPDSQGRWGACTGCGELWPCPTWLWAQALAIQFLGRAADRYLARVKATPDLEESA